MDKLREKIASYEPFGPAGENEDLKELLDHCDSDEDLDYHREMYEAMVSRNYVDCNLLNNLFQEELIFEAIAIPSESSTDLEKLGKVLVLHQFVEEILKFLCDSMDFHLKAFIYPEQLIISRKSEGRTSVYNYCNSLEAFQLKEFHNYLGIDSLIKQARELNTNRNHLAHAILESPKVDKNLSNYFERFIKFLDTFLDMLNALDGNFHSMKKDFEQKAIECINAM